MLRDPVNDPPPEGCEVWVVHSSGEGRGYLLNGRWMLSVPGSDPRARGVTGWREVTEGDP